MTIRPRPRSKHSRDDRAAGQIDAEHVDLEHAPPVVRFHFPRARFLGVDARVRGEQVDRPERALDGTHHRVDGVARRDVRDHGVRVDLQRERLELVAGTCRHGDARARGGELARDVRADPASAACDQRNLSVKLGQRPLSPPATRGSPATRDRPDPRPTPSRAPRVARSLHSASSAARRPTRPATA